jgi:sigma-B regulation protein RsbQ
MLLKHPVLVLQCQDDIIAPLSIGQWLDHNLQHSQLVVMDATGHCPHLSAPDETIAAMRIFLTATQLALAKQ